MMKDPGFWEATIIAFVLLFVALAFTACASREAKVDCLASLSVAQLVGGEPIDWANVKQWNCKK